MTKPPSSQSRFTESAARLLPLLPSPLYTVALGSAAFMAAAEGVNGTLDITGDAAAAEALATPGAAPSPVHSRRPSQEEVSPASTGGGGAYPLSLCLVLKAGEVARRRRRSPSSTTRAPELLTASASPAKADAALQKLSSLLPGSTANGEKDDGSAYPDLCACVRGRRVDAASVAAAAAAAALVQVAAVAGRIGAAPQLARRSRASSFWTR